ncbi:unnamed protein product [Rotaria socialis]|uniref:Uncharacterized protein n=1 Tax=Rotaria socialis TaxID=392032 RepID=A0A820MK87_9BILA|nr:unnamed protein product [Rotaria socialis]CAF3464498.1 unnamed protein product [Rotaria socialis]CAF4375222.1 unnamed protein product [Rotaria socialis]CAF4561108.1 unnamed protein product [Rotaria socialis]
MLRTPTVGFATLLLLQYIEIAQGVTCASNPCNLIAGLYEPSNGYCCYDVPPTFRDALCTCPNNVQAVVNAPCRTTTNQAICSKRCVNGGVCNIVNGQEVCWCQLGFSGAYCEIQGILGRCSPGLCQVGTCVEQTIGSSTHAYCQCAPGYRGITCNQCYFTCPRQGVFPDTSQCSIGRYFYCAQPNGAPIAATCPNGQTFNRLTSQCDNSVPCT